MESFLADLKKQVQCFICNGKLTDPKLAYCFHTFCKKCIKTNTQQDDEGENNVFKCPQCDSKTSLQDLNDVEDLKNSPLHSRILQVLAFVENEKICSISASHSQASYQCLECNDSLCEECLPYHKKSHQVISLSDLKKEDIEKMLRRECPCKTHDDQDVILHCHDCDMLICLYCMKDFHRNHKTKTLQEFVDIKKDSMSKTLEQIAKISQDKNENKQQEQFALLMQHDGEKAKKQIKELTIKLQKRLKDKEQKLLYQVDKDITKAGRNLRCLRHASQAQEYINKLVEAGTASDLASNQDVFCSEEFIYDPYPQDTTGIVFDHNEELCKQVEYDLGLVRPFKKADPKVSAIEVNSSNIEVSKKSKLKVNLKTSEGDNTDETLENVSIQFTPEDNVEVEEVQMTDGGEITVNFTPRVCCQLTVDVQLHGNTVSNSPMVMLTKPRQIEQMKNSPKLKDALNAGTKDFTGIAVNGTNSKIAVADQESNCVKVFNMEGDLLLTYVGQDNGQDQLNKPYGLAFLNKSDLVIADSDNHRICIMDTTTGQLVKTFGSHGNCNGQFQFPYGVHVNDDSNIITCDYNNNRVQVFTKDGEYLFQFSVPRPYSAITHNGLFYVSDQKTSMVHVIKVKDNQSPNTIATIDGKKYMDGQLQRPCGLAMDKNNNLLISDHFANLIYEFTLDGHYVGRSSHLMKFARYIAVLNNGQLICTTGEGVVFFSNTNKGN